MAPPSIAARRPTDPLHGLVGFTVVLRDAGLAITTDRVAAFLSALDALDVTSRTQTYWAGRLTLCSDPDDLPRYDRAFADWFDPRAGQPDPGASTSGRRRRRASPRSPPDDPGRTARRARTPSRSTPGRAAPRCCATATSASSPPPSASTCTG